MARTLAALNLLGLIFSFLGGILLAYALTMTSSNYRLGETTGHSVAICLDERLVATGFGGPMIVTDEPCPKGIGPSRAPVIEAERPTFFPWGLRLLCIGFLLQMPSAILALK